MTSPQFQVAFKSSDRRWSLLVARRFVTACSGVLSVLRGEHVRFDGAIYVLVEGTKTSIEDVMGSIIVHPSVTTSVEAPPQQVLDECLNCGNIADEPYATCPACDFNEIAPCPHCETSVPRTSYLPDTGDISRCPQCSKRVRLRFADPMWTDDGYYVQPVVEVLKAET